MKRVHMHRTSDTRVGTLKGGKSYPVPDDVADQVAAEGAGVILDDGDAREQATAAPQEDAARVTRRPRTRATQSAQTDALDEDDGDNDNDNDNDE